MPRKWLDSVRYCSYIDKHEKIIYNSYMGGTMKYLLIFLLGCGVTVKPKPIVVGPDFEAGYAQCRNIYKDDEEKVESCFHDFRNFLNVNVKISTDVILTFCDKAYESPSPEFSSCVSDLIEVLKRIK